MKIVTIIGARPQIIKAAAISRAIHTHFKHQITEVIVHTGQHYDENMSAIFFTEMSIPKANYNLSVGSGNHGAQTAKMIEGIEAILISEKPEALLVYGDTNSTLAGALAAAKIHIPVVHIEAGLRSYNKSMPEEINRITCDHCSTLLFSPTHQGIENLKKEGFSMEIHPKAHVDRPLVFKTGDIMYDNSMYFSRIANENNRLIAALNLTSNAFILCTIHRDSNTDHPEHLNQIIRGILAIQRISSQAIVLPLHPRTRKKMTELLEEDVAGELNSNKNIHVIDPAGFLDMISLESNCSLVITDSGGVQKEAFFFKKPCIILREQTEWVEIVANGNAMLVGSNEEKLVEAYHQLTRKNDYTYPPFFGDGHASEEICRLMIEYL
ncbi:MAG: non-hydrolyzing UDP-N-acetylglucosamine 2-epimerase [Flavobacteriales bacterium]